jgi:aryl carrier-like protein
VGQSDYCAANAFQDALAAGSARFPTPRILSVNWDTWAEAGMAVSSAVSQAQREDVRRFGMTSAEGVEIFVRTLECDARRILVSTRDLTTRVTFARRAENRQRVPETGPGPVLHSRPALQAEYVAPRSPLEKELADIWQSVLGIEAVGVADSFFELGGDSVTALRMIHRMKSSALAQALPVRLVSLYEAPTIETLVNRLASPEGGESALRVSTARARYRAEAMRRRREESS